ncbi:hypothetical protein ACNOIU_15940 (plasmid) [Exiguobacterium mexicanum]|uniref:hypothetical protein n=1 Tax=Exiguobacterium mexicanum TaxID=340146 RepID=UPI003AB26269
MAEKRYVAIFDAKDRVSPAMDKIVKSTDRARDAKGRFLKATEQADRAQDRMTRSTTQQATAIDRMSNSAQRAERHIRSLGDRGVSATRGLIGNIGRLTGMLTSLPSLIAGAGAAFGAWKLGDAVIGGAFRQEMARTQMNALAGNETLGSDLYTMMRSEANNSIFSTSDYTQATRSYLGFSKNEGELKEMLDVTKKLALWDPAQGFDGASFALKEAMSGDLMSLSERFEMPKSMLRDNGFSSAGSYLDNMRAVAKTLNAQNMTDKAVEDFESTGMGQYMEFKNKSSEWLGFMGEQSVEEMKPFFTKLNAFFGSDKASKFANDMSVKIGGLFDRLTNSLGTTSWEDMQLGLENTIKLFEETGRGAGILLDGLTGGKGQNPGDVLENLGRGIGVFATEVSSLNKELQDAFTWFDESGWKRRFKKFADFGSRDEIEGKRKGAFKWIYDGVTGEGWDTTKTDGSHRAGLGHVPFDGYTAELHQGERVLTKQQNREYGQAARGQVLITGNAFHVRQESDIDAIGQSLLRQLQLRT